ncbi:MAG: hypothetical protein NC548_48965 [Lachnospiraceae bacterium]|nr:hypothetical protein [Lachnospiraceae bacterium]
MKCRIILFYKDVSALFNYLCQFRKWNPNETVKMKNEWRYESDGFSILCRKGLSENFRGYRADIICVQEELTWGDEWPGIRDCILRPMLTSPIDIQVFDGVSKEESERVDVSEA